MSHSDRLFGEPDGAFGTTQDGNNLLFACAHCDEVITEPIVLRAMFTARMDNHFTNTHGMEAWNVRNLDASTQEAMSCIYDGQPDWLHTFDHDERNN